MRAASEAMQKTLYSRHNDILLSMLRRAREEERLRQADLAARLGRAQATVSKAETGERRLDVIELREWLAAMAVDFVAIVQELDHRLGALHAGTSRSMRTVRRGPR